MAVSDSARDELRALREQVNQLMDDRVTPVLHDAGRRAQKAAGRAGSYAQDYADRAGSYAQDAASKAGGYAQTYAKQARGYAEDGADAVADQVRDMPLIAIGVAAAVGFLFGRITK